MALYTYTHQSGTIAAGALVQFAPVAETPVYQPLNGIVQTPEVSTSIANVEDTTIADTVKTYILGMRDGAELSVELYEYPADTDQLAFITNAELKTPANMLLKIEFSNGITYSFEVIVMGFSRSAKDNEGINSVTVNMKITGDVTRVTAA